MYAYGLTSRQPLTLTIEGIVHAIYGSYMDMDYEPPEARGELILKWICAPGVLETLRRERRPELVAHEPRKQDDEERRVREFPHDELKEKQDRPLSIERLMQHFEED